MGRKDMKAKLWVIIGVLIIASIAMVAPVAAVNTGTTIIAGNPPATVDIALSGDIANMPLTPGTTNTDPSVTLTVSANVPFYVKVRDDMSSAKPAGSAGKMVDYETGPTTYGTAKLGAAMGLTGTTLDTTSKTDLAALTAVDQTLETGSAAVSSQGLGLTFSQVVAYTDARLGAGHVYRIVVLFTGSPS